MSFITILNKHRKISFSERDKGDRFERLMQSYLYTDPKYAHLKKVWLWSEFPFRSDFGSHDIGIDLVAQTSEGEYWAVQCKAYREDARITKQEVGNPRYILDLLLSVINVSVQTVDIVNGLPKLTFETNQEMSND